MKRNTKWAAVLVSAAFVALTAAPFFAQQIQSSKDEVALRAAMERETVRGDPKGAIEEYKKLAQSKDRALAARALVRMAESYQKLGDAEAQKVYQLIVREYADQKDALALAQARLGGSAVANTKGDRVVWRGPKVDNFGRVSADGRFITYVDWSDGRLMLHDIAANVDRALTPAAPNYSQQAEWSAISRDGKQVVYDWLGEKGVEFRIASVQGSGFVQPRRLNGGYYSPMDWSPDGKWIAGVTGSAEQAKADIGLISVADGSFRILKTVDGSVFRKTRNRTVVSFSPDGKFIAYDRPGMDGDAQRDVFVLSIDGKSEVRAVANGVVMGWARDGTLLFSSNRTGSQGLWGLLVSDGKVQGRPELLKSNIGESISLGVSDSGALYVYKRNNNTRDIAIAPIDLDAGKLLGPPVSFFQGSIDGAASAFWSPDGKYLAYPVPCNKGCTAIRSVATGEVRRVGAALRAASAPFWSPDGRSLLLRGDDGRQGIFRIDVQSGESSIVYVGDGLSGPLAEWSRDGKKVYFNRRRVLIERDLDSGAEREIDRELNVTSGNLSPDGKYFIGTRTDTSAKTSSLLLVPVAEGQPRELLRLTQPESIALFGSWTPDGSVIFTKDTGSRKEVWLVPVTGGRPRKLDIDPAIWWDGSEDRPSEVSFRVSPDGRRISFLMGRSVREVWALENFLPAPGTKK